MPLQDNLEAHSFARAGVRCSPAFLDAAAREGISSSLVRSDVAQCFRRIQQSSDVAVVFGILVLLLGLGL